MIVARDGMAPARLSTIVWGRLKTRAHESIALEVLGDGLGFTGGPVIADKGTVGKP